MKTVLIDDEKLALEFLERQLDKIGDTTVVGVFTDPLQGLNYITDNEVDVVFLDINMPRIDGLMLASKIQKVKPQTKIVFVTAYDQHAVSAFELNVVDYIVKPIRLHRLQNTINRLKNGNATRVSQTYLHIQLCDQLLLGRDRANLEAISWRTSKVKELFLYLLNNENQLVSKAYLVELLWPNLDPDKAFAQLYTSIYHVRNNLRDYTDHFEIRSSLEGYILNTQRVLIDIREWENQIKSLPPVSKESVDSYEQAMELNHAPYLNMYDYLWAESDRYNYEQLWLKAALEIGGYYFNTDNLSKAIKWYKEVTTRQPIIEEAHLSLMIIYEKLNEQSLIKKQFSTLKTVTEEELGVLPSKKVMSWYKDWENQKDFSS